MSARITSTLLFLFMGAVVAQDPPEMAAECVLNTDCPNERACIRHKCQDPCPGTCSQGAMCKVVNHIPICTCPTGTTGNPFIKCWPLLQVEVTAECVRNTDCPNDRACINDKCQDPCPGYCVEGAMCMVKRHFPFCICPTGTTGDPFSKCRPLLQAEDNAHQRNKRQDPCSESCGQGARCEVVERLPTCGCPLGTVGDPHVECKPLSQAPYVKHCKGNDPKLMECLIKALHHLRPYLAKGIPEIQMPTVEPFRMDDLSLALTSGPNGYKIVLRDMDIYGASNFSVQKLKLGHNGAPFEAKIRIPRLNLDARYTSTGVLIILPANGNGTFHANLVDIQANVKGYVSEQIKESKSYLHVDKLDFDLSIKETRMQVKKIFNNNRILTEATNLFLRENGQDILKIMMPQLKTKLALVFKRVANQLLSNVPTEVFYTES